MLELAHALVFTSARNELIATVAALAALASIGLVIALSAMRAREGRVKALLLEEIQSEPGDLAALVSRLAQNHQVRLRASLLLHVLHDLQWEGRIWLRQEPGRDGRPASIFYIPARPRSPEHRRSKETAELSIYTSGARGLRTSLPSASYIQFAITRRRSASGVERP